MTKGVKLQLGDPLIQAAGKQLEYKQTCLQPAGSDQLELASTGGCGDGAVTGFKWIHGQQTHKQMPRRMGML